MYQTHYQLLIISISLSSFFFSSLQDEQHYGNCKQKFKCGEPNAIGELKFPFWGLNRPKYCGKPGFEIKCINNTPIISNSTYDLRVIETDPQDKMIMVSMADFSNTLCPSTVLSRKLTNFSILELDSSSIYVDPNNSYSLLTLLYGCPSELGHQLSWSSAEPCSTNKSLNLQFVTHTVNSSITSRCLYVAVLPILQQNVQHLDDNPSSLGDVLDQGFAMKWFTREDDKCQACIKSSGDCGYDWSKDQFTCYCPDNTIAVVCSQSKQASFSSILTRKSIMKLTLPTNLITLILFKLFLSSFCIPNGKYNACSQRIECGHLSDISYPFYDEITRPEYCGKPGFKLDCLHDGPQINISFLNFFLLTVNGSTSTVSRTDTWLTSCPSKLVNSTIDPSLYELTSLDQNITFFYGCKKPVSRVTVSCLRDEGGYYMTRKMKEESKYDLWDVCEGGLNFPILESSEAIIDTSFSEPPSFIMNGVFKKGFELGMKAEFELCNECLESGGQCGYNSNSTKFVCYCIDGNYDTKCQVIHSVSHKGSKRKTLIIGISIGAAVLLALLGGCFIFAQRRRSQLIESQKTRGVHPSSSNEVGLIGSNGVASSQAYTTTPSTTLSQTTPSYGSSVSDIARDKTSYFGVHVFDYTVLEHATSNFHESKELGEGGFGTVYYGVLPDGRQVAVKRLYENSFKRVEQFMNEIRILAEIHHKNLVALYGCTSRRSRELLLVYEYISNGTVADHIHGKLAESTFVPWLTRLNIAIETAEALAFLHRKDVIHRDVKTTNILLDNEFHVKVADFGLSRLFPMDMTHVSTAPQGTPGYVDPEYYQCYKLTEKSDVYSFGVVLIELISSKRAVDITRHRHHVNLANMALDWIQNQEMDKLVDPRLGFDRDHTIKAMVNMVGELGFRCLQQDRDMRPTMDEVMASLRAIQLEGLKGQKQEVVDIIVYGDDVGLLTNPTPPLSPELPRSNDVV